MMTLRISKWGNCLAVRIPADVVRTIGLREGDAVQLTLTIDGAIAIRPAAWDRRTFSLELEATRAAMPVSDPVIEELRRGGRY